MPLQQYEHRSKTEFTKSLVAALNEIIDYTNSLEARLAALEHPVERLSDEDWEKVNYKQVFKEDKEGDLTLVNDLIIKGQLYKQGTVIRQGQKLGGCTWSMMKYLSLACKTREDGVKEVVGFLAED